MSFQGAGYGGVVSRLSAQPGWLMYVNPDTPVARQAPGQGASPMVLHGSVMQFELTYQQDYHVVVMDTRFRMTGAALLQGRPADQMMQDALQAYPGESGKMPPQIAAMRELARCHPGEYQALCEKHGLPPLVVQRDPWAAG